MFLGNINLNGFVEKHIDGLKYPSCGNTSGTNANMHKTQEREQNVQGEEGCASLNSVEALIGDGFQAQRNKEGEVVAIQVGVNEQTSGSGKDLMGPITNSLAAIVVDTSSYSGLKGQKTWLGC
ncbi:hypothetical protein Tco_1459636 [Tanacetum coccineum]